MKDLYKRDSQSDTAQETAIRHGAGPCAVIAGPGSGKTRVLTRRIRYLIEERGVPASSILVLTFSRAAAANMRRRFLQESGSAAAAAGVTFGTFHSFFYQILQLSSQERPRLISPSSRRAYLRHLCDLGPDLPDRMPDTKPAPATPGLPGLMPARTSPEDLQLLISRFKNGLPCRQPWLAALVEEYDRWLQSRGWIDFDDMILRCRDLLQQDPAVLEEWRRRFRWILVDEFQDVSRSQYEVLLLLAAPRNNVFVVGDDDQSIYGFRGAAPGTMRQFLEDFSLDLPDADSAGPPFPDRQPTDDRQHQSGPESRLRNRREQKADSAAHRSGVVFLTSNYRCGKAILEASAALIRDNRDRIEKRFVSKSGCSGAFVCRAFTEKEQEYAFLAEILQSMSAQERAQTAVIFRTHAGAQSFLDSLSASGIPFLAESTERRKKTQTAQEVIVGDLLAYYRSAALLSASRSGFLSAPSPAGPSGSRSGSRHEGPGVDSRRSSSAYAARMLETGKRDLLRIMNRPERFLSGTFLDGDRLDPEALFARAGFEYAAVRELLEDLALLDSLPPAYSMRYLLDSMGYRTCAAQTDKNSGPFLESLLGKARQFSAASSWISFLTQLEAEISAARDDPGRAGFLSIHPAAEENSPVQSTPGSAGSFSADPSASGNPLSAPGRKKGAAFQIPGRSGPEPEGRVHVITMHACKGLEFDTVLIPDLNEGNVPSRRALSLQEIEEERRLLYVAMTRARRSLTLTWLEGTADRPATPSRFLHRFL